MDNEQRIVRDFSPEERALFAQLLRRAVRNMGGQPELQFDEEETHE